MCQVQGPPHGMSERPTSKFNHVRLVVRGPSLAAATIGLGLLGPLYFLYRKINNHSCCSSGKRSSAHLLTTCCCSSGSVVPLVLLLSVTTIMLAHPRPRSERIEQTRLLSGMRMRPGMKPACLGSHEWNMLPTYVYSPVSGNYLKMGKAWHFSHFGRLSIDRPLCGLISNSYDDGGDEPVPFKRRDGPP